MIRIDDLQHVVIDDDMVGDLPSAVANWPKQAAEIASAAVAWMQAQDKAKDEQITALIEQAQQAEQVATLTQQLAAMTIDRDAQVAEVANLQQAMTGYWQKTTDGKKLNLQMGIAQLNGSIASQQQMAQVLQAELAQMV